MNDVKHTTGTLPGLLRRVHVGRKSGALQVERGEERHILRFVQGQVVDVETNVAELSLPKLLAARGLMPPEVASDIAQDAERGQKPLLRTLQERGDIEKSRLDEVRADQLRTIAQRVAEWVDAQQAFEEGDASGAAEAVPGVSTGDLILTAVAAIKDPNVARYALGDLDRILVHSNDPQLRFQKITLKPNDGYLLSRVDGTSSVRQVAQLVPASPDEIVQSLFGLYCAGLVDFLELTAQPARPKRVAPAADTPPTPPPRVAEPAVPSPAQPAPPISPQASRTATPAAPAVATPAATPAKPAKEPDNEARHYQDILDFHSELKTKNHFEILGLTRSATETQVREAYFQLAKRYHPDVHRGPAFAAVSDKIAAILVRLGEAYEVLKDPARRGSYESLVASRMPRPPAADGAAVSTSGPSSAGDSELGAKLVEEALRSGEKLFAEEKYWEAIQAVEPQLSRTRGTMRARARVLLAKSYLKNPKWVKRAEEQLGLVVEEEPRHVEAHFLLASIYLGGGLRGRALSKFRKVIELQPDHEEARARVSELTPPPEPTPPPPSGGFIKRLFGRGQEE